jgi:iron(III) transport system permease protein
VQGSLRRRVREFALIARDPVLMISLVYCGLFLFIFVVFPLFKGTANGFFDKDSGALSFKYFERYFDAFYGPYNRWVFWNTLQMGVATAIGGTALGFVFAYTMVRCSIPFKNVIHILALVPTVSPPFALALSSILLFGRNGLVSHQLLGVEFGQGVNDIYGLDGLVFVQVISYFSVAYLIVRAMLERLDPSMEEAAHSLGAGKLHIFRTVTLPLLIPGIAGAFLLLFVESLADLGNPLFISGNQVVLSAQIFLAVVGEYDYQKASTLAFVLLIPTLVVFLVQRYYVTRRSYVSVTGKPTGGHILVKEPWLRWSFIIVTYAVCGLIIVMYLAIILGSFSAAWGVDYTPTLRWWQHTLTRGVESILDTTFLSAVATPLAALTGMVIAFLVVRKSFSGKEVLDFTSNLGGAVPGTILGIGFVLAFNLPPLGVVGILYTVLALFLVLLALKDTRERWLTLIGGSALAVMFAALNEPLGELLVLYIVAALFTLLGLYVLLLRKRKGAGWALIIMGLYLFASDLVEYAVAPLVEWSRGLERGFLANAVTQLPDYIRVFVQIPAPLLAILYAIILLTILEWTHGRERPLLAMIFLGLIGGMCFMGKPLAIVGSAYVIIAAFVVRSIPASVRAGVAALQQIDPSIEEASSILGGDAQYTFRKVTLPLILPALLAGLIFSFTRHMTSLSAIIFLVNARWRIITATILSEWEQGGISVAAAYMTVIIILVLVAIGVLYFITNRLLRGRGDVDLGLGV